MKTVEEFLNELRTTKDEHVDVSGVGIRYRNGKYQMMCMSCTVEKWDDIADEYAEQLAKDLLR